MKLLSLPVFLQCLAGIHGAAAFARTISLRIAHAPTAEWTGGLWFSRMLVQLGMKWCL
jgi:hypothetical protein